MSLTLEQVEALKKVQAGIPALTEVAQVRKVLEDAHRTDRAAEALAQKINVALAEVDELRTALLNQIARGDSKLREFIDARDKLRLAFRASDHAAIGTTEKKRVAEAAQKASKALLTKVGVFFGESITNLGDLEASALKNRRLTASEKNMVDRIALVAGDLRGSLKSLDTKNDTILRSTVRARQTMEKFAGVEYRDLVVVRDKKLRDGLQGAVEKMREQEQIVVKRKNRIVVAIASIDAILNAAKQTFDHDGLMEMLELTRNVGVVGLVVALFVPGLNAVVPGVLAGVGLVGQIVVIITRLIRSWGG